MSGFCPPHHPSPLSLGDFNVDGFGEVVLVRRSPPHHWWFGASVFSNHRWWFGSSVFNNQGVIYLSFRRPPLLHHYQPSSGFLWFVVCKGCGWCRWWFCLQGLWLLASRFKDCGCLLHDSVLQGLACFGCCHLKKHLTWSRDRFWTVWLEMAANLRRLSP